MENKKRKEIELRAQEEAWKNLQENRKPKTKIIKKKSNTSVIKFYIFFFTEISLA